MSQSVAGCILDVSRDRFLLLTVVEVFLVLCLKVMAGWCSSNDPGCRVFSAVQVCWSGWIGNLQQSSHLWSYVDRSTQNGVESAEHYCWCQQWRSLVCL